MKQKMVYIVLLVAGIYLPAPSKECGKVCPGVEMKQVAPAQVVQKKPAVAAEDISSIPASPLTRAAFNL